MLDALAALYFFQNNRFFVLRSGGIRIKIDFPTTSSAA
jgi:hypothetical protein